MKKADQKANTIFLKTLMYSITVIGILSAFQVQNDLEASIQRGKEVYAEECAKCHKLNGKGSRNKYPPLAKSDYLLADKTRSIQVIINGLGGPISVNNINYEDVMLPSDLTQQETMDVLNYVRNSWGNQGEIVTLEEVKVAAEG